jgi:hypothetical protein
MSQFTNYPLSYDYLESPEVEEYVNKMYKESVKMSSYMRWISILQSIKQYKDDNYVFNVELEKTENYDNFDDVVNYRTRVNLTKPNGMITDFNFQTLWTIHTRDDSEWGSFNKILNRMTKLIHTDYMNNLKEVITEGLPVSSMNIMDFVDIDFKVNSMLNTDRPTSRNSDYEFVKLTPKTLKYKKICEVEQKVFNRIEKHPNYYITPIIKLQGEFSNYNPNDLDQLHRSFHNVVELMKVRFLNLYEDLFDNNQQSSPLLKVIEEKFDECCVCYETTNTYTNWCNHPLCDSCVKQIRNKKCPMCRTDLKEGLSMEQRLQQQYERNRRERRNRQNNETFNGETKEIEQEQKEETVLQEQKEEVQEEVEETQEQVDTFLREEFGEISDEENELLEVRLIHKYNPDFHFTIYKRYIIDYQRIVVNSRSIQIYKFHINIPDTDIMKLFPTILRNPEINMSVNENMGWVEICVG